MLKLDIWIDLQLSSPVVLLLVLFSSFWLSFRLQDLWGFIHTKSDTDRNKKAAFLINFQWAWLHFLDTNTTQWTTGLGCSVVMSCYANFVRQSLRRSARFGRSVRSGVNAPLVFTPLLLHLPFLALPPFFSLHATYLYLRPPLCCHLLPKLCPTHQTGLDCMFFVWLTALKSRI